MPRIIEPEENKPIIPECSRCHTKGIDAHIEQGLCKWCWVDKNPEKFGLPDGFSLTKAFEERMKSRKPLVSDPLPDPEQDKFKDAFQPEIGD